MVQKRRVSVAHAQKAAQVYSLSLPLALASRLAALGELHPHKTQAELLTDLVALGLSEVERQWPGRPAQAIEFHPDPREAVYLVTGPFAEFHGLTHKHHLALEQALANPDPQTNFSPDDYALGGTE